jgi:hypothetical protein
MGKKMWLQYIAAVLKNRKGVEGLPLKYTIIILVAALIIAIVVVMFTDLKQAILGGTSQISNATQTKVNESLNFT